MTRLSKKDKYERPDLTYTEKLTQDEIEDKLEDYQEIADLSKVQLGTHIRYIIDDNGTKKFRLGGKLINTKGLPTYVVLGNGRLTWSVQTEGTTFYREMTKEEIKEEYEQVIDDLEIQVEKHLKTIDTLKQYIKGLKEQNKKPIKN